MTQPPAPDDSQSGIGFRLFKGRKLGPLLGPWISSTFFAALIFYAERTLPALREVTGLLYFILLVIVVITTGRWLRVRSSDRREKDRRQTQK